MMDRLIITSYIYRLTQAQCGLYIIKQLMLFCVAFSMIIYIINLKTIANLTIRSRTTPTAMAIAQGGGIGGASGCQHSISCSLHTW